MSSSKKKDPQILLRLFASAISIPVLSYNFDKEKNH